LTIQTESVLSISDITQPLISLLISSFLAQIQKMLGRDWSGGLIHKAVMKKM